MPATKLSANAMATIFCPANNPFGIMGFLAPFHSHRTKATSNARPAELVSVPLWINFSTLQTDD